MYGTFAETTTLAAALGRKSELLDSGEILLRAFRPDTDDERQMRELVFDNAFLGQPFDVICPCKRWFGDVVLTPYIRYQPEHIHVAVHQTSGRLVGYLTGATAGQQFDVLRSIQPPVYDARDLQGRKRTPESSAIGGALALPSR